MWTWCSIFIKGLICTSKTLTAFEASLLLQSVQNGYSFTSSTTCNTFFLVILILGYSMNCTQSSLVDCKLNCISFGLCSQVV
mmetsp:Transcript_5170/g.6806  ORF Transcript_5170/g.6806 Transcript_5170/m.6806 type:complete len:82 (+) Transcript_5170:42-287(+)